MYSQVFIHIGFLKSMETPKDLKERALSSKTLFLKVSRFQKIYQRSNFKL